MPSPLYCSVAGVDMAYPLLRLRTKIRGEFIEKIAVCVLDLPHQNDRTVQCGGKVECRMSVTFRCCTFSEISDHAAIVFRSSFQSIRSSNCLWHLCRWKQKNKFFFSLICVTFYRNFLVLPNGLDIVTKFNALEP